jgi:hypothetical protein
MFTIYHVRICRDMSQAPVSEVCLCSKGAGENVFSTLSSLWNADIPAEVPNAQ